SDFIIPSSFVIALTSERSHLLDHVVAKLRALDFCRAFHQPREIVRDTYAGDRAGKSFQNQIGSFGPAHVTEHHFTGKNYRARIHLILIGILRRGAMGRLENCVAGDVVDVSSGRYADSTHLRSQRVTEVIAI